MRLWFLVVAWTGCASYDAPGGPDAGGPDVAVGGGSNDPNPAPDASGVQPGNPAARMAYKQNVFPIQRDVCGYWCHGATTGPVFVDIINADNTYANILALPALTDNYADDAPIVVYNHLPASNAKAFDTSQLAVVRDWLRLERGQ